MFSNLENAIVIAAAIWAGVRLLEHFAPSFFDLKERRYWYEIEARIMKLEEAAQTKTTKAK